MKKIFWLALFVAVFGIGILVLRFFFCTEDEWVCENGEWTRHGNPTISKPKTVCVVGKTGDSKNERVVTSTKIILYFANNKIDPEFLDCGRLNAVERDSNERVDKYRYALTQLLLGPSNDEENAGYYSLIGRGVRIQELSFIDGEVNVDFSVDLNKDAAGSCKVTAIRAQITDTLKQFPEVKNVNISIGGNREDILQP